MVNSGKCICSQSSQNDRPLGFSEEHPMHQIAGNTGVIEADSPVSPGALICSHTSMWGTLAVPHILTHPSLNRTSGVLHTTSPGSATVQAMASSYGQLSVLLRRGPNRGGINAPRCGPESGQLAWVYQPGVLAPLPLPGACAATRCMSVRIKTALVYGGSERGQASTQACNPAQGIPAEMQRLSARMSTVRRDWQYRIATCASQPHTGPP